MLYKSLFCYFSFMAGRERQPLKAYLDIIFSESKEGFKFVYGNISAGGVQ